MKKQFALGLLAAVAASGAFAQSSVTIYGRLNVTVESVKFGEGDRQGEVVDNASRIGFKGVEDLGGGLKAGFQIEHGFDASTGAAAGGTAAFWGRQSEVNLSGGFGTVRLGRWTPESYFATADYISMHNHDTGRSEDKLYVSPFAQANKVGYASPVMGGFQFHASAAEGGTGFDRTYDLAANYDAGPLHLGAGYAKEGDNKQVAIRGLYEMGAFTVGAYYQRASVDGLGDRNSFRVSGMYAFGASELHLNVGRANEWSDASDTEATQFTVGYNYNLSKRTKVYGFYTRVNDDAAVYTGDFNTVALGIRHNF